MTHMHSGCRLDRYAALGAAALLLCASSAGAQCFEMASGVEYPVISNAMDVGDIDGDKDNDIVLAMGVVTPGNDVRILRNNGSGVFSNELLFDGTHNLNGVAAGDMNGDGAVDLVLSLISSGIGVLLNQGDGTFGPLTIYGTTSATAHLADLDNDGDLDVYSSAGYLNVWLNDGKGALGTPTSYPGKKDSAAGATFAADFNGDSFLDIVGSVDLSVFINNGDGTFADQYSAAKGVTVVRGHLATDLDGDADNDIVYGSDVEFRTLMNDGSGAFGAGPAFETEIWAQVITSADFDDDHDQDIAIGRALGLPMADLVVALNAGDGSFVQGAEPFASRPVPTSILSADFNGDGMPDIAVQSYRFFPIPESGYVTVYLNTTQPRRTDINHDGVINSTDVGEFINMYFSDQAFGTLTADFDANGISNSTDVGEFINVWFEETALGCG